MEKNCVSIFGTPCIYITQAPWFLGHDPKDRHSKQNRSLRKQVQGWAQILQQLEWPDGVVHRYNRLLNSALHSVGLKWYFLQNFSNLWRKKIFFHTLLWCHKTILTIEKPMAAKSYYILGHNRRTLLYFGL